MNAQESQKTNQINNDELEELKAIFELPPLLVSYAVELSGKKGIPLKDAFRYADSLYDYGDDFDYHDKEDETIEYLSPEEALRQLGDDEFYQFMFFERGISVSLADELCNYRNISDEELRQADTEMLRCYQLLEDHTISFNYLKKAWNYYQQHIDDRYGDDELFEYLELIDSDIPYEKAFDELEPLDEDDYDRASQTDAKVPEEWEKKRDGLYDELERQFEQEGWYNRERFDGDTDTDNPEYDDDTDSEDDYFDF